MQKENEVLDVTNSLNIDNIHSLKANTIHATDKDTTSIVTNKKQKSSS